MRKHLSTKAREALLIAHKRICHLCKGEIQDGQAWEVSHPIPLAAGGDDVPENRAPAHKKCHRKQTSEIDQPLIAKIRRIRQKHIGASAPKRRIPSRPFSQWRSPT